MISTSGMKSQTELNLIYLEQQRKREREEKPNIPKMTAVPLAVLHHVPLTTAN